MAKILKIVIDKNSGKKPLTPLQKKLLKGPVMSDQQYKDWLKEKKSLFKWKVK
jgi:hypothetical protein